MIFWLIVTGISMIGYKTNCNVKDMHSPITILATDSSAESRLDCLLIIKTFKDIIKIFKITLWHCCFQSFFKVSHAVFFH